MKADFNRPFTDPLGNPIDENGKPTHIGRNLGFQLFNLQSISGKQLTPQEKFLAYTLSVKIANSTAEVDLTAEECDLIDRAAFSLYKAGAYGNIKELITEK